MTDQITVVLAGYPSVELAERDYGIFKTFEKEGTVPVLDLAVVEKDSSGKVGVVRELHHPVRKGVIVGALLGVVLGPAGVVAGAAAGAAGGKVFSLMGDGIGKATMKELGDFLEGHSVMLVVAAKPAVAETVKNSLNDATRIMTKTVDVSHDDVEEAADAGSP